MANIFRMDVLLRKNVLLRRMFLVAFAMLFLLLLGFPWRAEAQSFPDVVDGDVHFGAVEYLKLNGVIDGYPDGTFQPDATINRAEALKMVVIASGVEETDGESTAEISFPDVAKSDWFFDYIVLGVEEGIIEGYSDGSFLPGNNINVAESLKIIFLTFDAEIGNPPTRDPYPDVSTEFWYSTYAKYGKDRQFLWSQDNGYLNAGRDITRGEFAEIIYRLMFTEENGLPKFPLSTDWPSYQHKSQNYLVKYPFGWEISETDHETIFWTGEMDGGQVSWYRLFPNSATVVVSVDSNEDGLTLDQYVNRLQYDHDPVKQTLTLNNYPFVSIAVKTTLTTDYFFELPDGSILVAYSQLGGGPNSPMLAEEIRNIIGSVRYRDGGEEVLDLTAEEFLAEVRKKILMEDEGQEALNLFDALILIETDTIGIGTGPIDYFYSEEYDVTLKFERDSNTLLGMSDGNTTAF